MSALSNSDKIIKKQQRKLDKKIRTLTRKEQRMIKEASLYELSDEETEKISEHATVCDSDELSVKCDNYPRENKSLYCIYCVYCIDDYGEIAYVVCNKSDVYYCKRCEKVLEIRLAIPQYTGSIENKGSKYNPTFNESILAKNPFYIHE